MAMRSTMLATASSWPITRWVKKLRIEPRSIRSRVSRIDTGKPVSCESVRSTSCGPIVPCSERTAASFKSWIAEPGRLAALRYCRAEATATSAQPGAMVNSVSSESRRATSRASVSVAPSERGSISTTSKMPRSAGRICRSRATLVRVASVQTISRPATIAGRIWSRMLALWP